MQEDTLIQKNLFAIDNENNEQKEITKMFVLMKNLIVTKQFQN